MSSTDSAQSAGSPVVETVEATDGKLEVDVSTVGAPSRPATSDDAGKEDKSIDRNAVGQILPEGTRGMLMMFFLMSLGMLFASTLVGYFVIRLRQPEWPPPGTPALPFTVWISTLSILVCSGGMHWAVVSARNRNRQALQRAAVLTVVAGLAFVGLQVFNWIEMVNIGIVINEETKDLYGFLFYFLTGLHAAHVLGGLIPLGLTLRSILKGRFDVEAARDNANLRMIASYWHFVDVVWLVLVLVLVVF